ncbi:MAG TPA: hypothetical protein G4O02_14490 [Caldilineae bacterium]|jgi:DNA repair exonuclease SbcCD nuclease subunit|nr:hypothetical protein [Caldilineae bacterium]
MKIAHLSDLHLRHHLPGTSVLPQRLSRAVPGLLEQAVRRIREEQPDLLVVTGDLLDYPLDALDDPEMQARGERDLHLIADILRTAGCPCIVVYGNHDHPELVRRVFAPLPTDRVLNDYRLLCFHDEEAADHFPERRGRELQRFIQALSDAESPPQIHIQHYLVWPERNEGYPHTYREAEELYDHIVKSGLVRLVLSGHYHRGILPFREGDTYFAIVPAFAESPHPYWIYQLDASDFHWHERIIMSTQGGI